MSRDGWADLWAADAVLLEVEGVLLDTSAGTRSAWRWWAARVGLDAEVVATASWGIPERDAIERLRPGGDTDEQLAAIRERRRVLLRTARKLRGAVSMVRSLPPARWAIVTSATAEQLEAQLGRLRLDPPAVVVTADDPPQGRPAPAAHLAASARLGADPHACVAFENSPAGIAAAHATGAVAVAVGPREVHGALAAADAIRSDLGGVQIRPLGDGRVEVRAFREPRIPT
jgi:mannitol-1-/sugar-/sorbitol-6-phosphatase